MTSDLTVVDRANLDTSHALDLHGGLSLEEVKTIGTVFHQSGMFKDMRPAAQAITKILAGQELGIPPMQAMQGYHIVDGNPRLSAGLIGALVKRSGRYDYRIIEANDTVCHIRWFQAKRDGSLEAVGDSEFTLLEAQTAGLATRTNWKTYAEDMLFARALTRGARRYCPDVFHGAVYTLGEEAEDQAERPQPVEVPFPKFSPPPIGEDDLRPEAAAVTAADSPQPKPPGSEPGGDHTLDLDDVDHVADQAQQRLETPEDAA